MDHEFIKSLFFSMYHLPEKFELHCELIEFVLQHVDEVILIHKIPYFFEMLYDCSVKRDYDKLSKFSRLLTLVLI